MAQTILNFRLQSTNKKLTLKTGIVMHREDFNKIK